MSSFSKKFLFIVLVFSFNFGAQASSYESHYKEMVQWFDTHFNEVDGTYEIPSSNCEVFAKKTESGFMVTINRGSSTDFFYAASSEGDPRYGQVLSTEVTSEDFQATLSSFSCETQGCGDYSIPNYSLFVSEKFLEIKTYSFDASYKLLVCTII